MTIEELDPALGVPDALYEELHWAAETREEMTAGRVLRVHRDWLNGGFEQTFNNLDAIEELAAEYVQSYSEIGLPAVANLVDEALAVWSAGQCSDDEWEPFDQRYKGLVYPSTTDDRDTIEAAVVRYIQRNAGAFANAFAAITEE